MIQWASGLKLVAGLWSEHFLLELAWTSNHCVQRINSHLPTWSWTSLDDVIRSMSCSYNTYRYAMPQVAGVVNMHSESLNPLFRGSTCLARCSKTLRARSREFEWTHSQLELFYAHDLGPATKGKKKLQWEADVMLESGQRTWVLWLFWKEHGYNDADIFGIVIIPSDTDLKLWVRVGSLYVISSTTHLTVNHTPLGEIHTIALI
jgi:hypothetical protein